MIDRNTIADKSLDSSPAITMVEDKVVDEGILKDEAPRSHAQDDREPTPENIVDHIPKNTQRVSSLRSEIPDFAEHRDFPCLKCAGEIFHFPDLVCWDTPNSVSGKCGDCTRKHGYCFPVSSVIFCCQNTGPSLVMLLLIHNQMHEDLYEKFMELDAVREAYNMGLHNSKRRLQAAQWDFDLAKRALNHTVKISNAKADKHPHAPVVAAITAIGAQISSTLMMLRDDINDQLQQGIVHQNEAITALIGEVRELRRVSAFLDIAWNSNG